MYKAETLLIVPTLVIEYFFIPFLPEVVGKGKFSNMLQRKKKRKGLCVTLHCRAFFFSDPTLTTITCVEAQFLQMRVIYCCYYYHPKFVGAYSFS